MLPARSSSTSGRGAVDTPGDAARRPAHLDRRPVRSRSGPGRASRSSSGSARSCRSAEVFTVERRHPRRGRRARSRSCGAGSYDAVVGIGGGRTLDVAKYAATRPALPMVAVATNLAHDGICSPVARWSTTGGKGSFGVAMPIAVVVDLDYVRAAPRAMVRAGIGDVLSNLSAIEDWRLAERERGEPVDGLAVTFARDGGRGGAAPHRTRSTTTTSSTALAEALVLSGMAMAAAGISAGPCSGACHEILHAIDALYPGTANHGELAGVGALFAATCAATTRCSDDRGLPAPPRPAAMPAELGLTDESSPRPSLRAATRPGPLHDPRAPRPRPGRDAPGRRRVPGAHRLSLGSLSSGPPP